MFEFSRQERQIILFLAALALAGIGIDFLAKKNCKIKEFISFKETVAKIDLNQADRQTLLSLPGIGEKISQRILDYRNKNGYFHKTEELLEIKGISRPCYEKIKEMLYVQE